MRQLLAALAFLTRVPAGKAGFTAEETARSSRWFPLVGLLLGGVYVLVLHAGERRLPAMVLAVLILGVEALATGCLHMDGLADMADGFGGGRSREDVLRIMRDHAIGTYGAVALILVILLKVTAIAALAERGTATAYLLMAPVLGRWSPVVLACWLPYARESGAGAVTASLRKSDLAIATTVTAALVLGIGGWRGAICWSAAAVFIALCGWLFRRRIGGVTGDALGATVEIVEAVTLFAGLLLP